MPYKAVLINRLGEFTEIHYTTQKNLITKFVCKGTGKPKILHVFDDIKYYGFSSGEENIINKTELPPPIDNELYYGDIIAFSDKKDLTIEYYKEFYDNIFDIEDLDDTLLEDEMFEQDDDYDYDDSFLVPDDEDLDEEDFEEEDFEED